MYMRMGIYSPSAAAELELCKKHSFPPVYFLQGKPRDKN